MDMSRETHQHTAVVDTSVSRKVPETVFAYYAAIFGYARMINVLKTSSRQVTAEEEAFMDLVYAGDFKALESLSYYFKSFKTVSYRIKESCGLEPRGVVQSEDESIGWFGRVDENTHYLYASYPRLAVYMKRIRNNFNYTTDRELDPQWNLPDDIAPVNKDAGLPTANLLGYGPSQVLQLLRPQARLSRSNYPLLSQSMLVPHMMPNIKDIAAYSDCK